MKIFDLLWWFFGIGESQDTSVGKNTTVKGNEAHPGQSYMQPPEQQHDMDDFDGNDPGFFDDEFMG